jgi:hypothetical protein
VGPVHLVITGLEWNGGGTWGGGSVDGCGGGGGGEGRKAGRQTAMETYLNKS